MPGIYRWRIILTDTDFFQQSVSVSAADFRGRNNRPSASTLLSNFRPSVYIKFQNSSKIQPTKCSYMNFSSVINGV